MFYVYLLYSLDNPTIPFYVGKGRGKRCLTHYSSATRNNPLLRSVLRKIESSGTRYAVRKVYRSDEEKEVFNAERRYISIFGRRNNGTGVLCNFTSGGEGISGFHHSEETKRRCSVAKRGRAPWNFGVPATESQKRKQSLAMSGRKASTETRLKLSLAHLGRRPWNKGIKATLETRAKLSLAKLGNRNGLGNQNRLGVLHTDAAKEKMSLQQHLFRQRSIKWTFELRS